MFTKKPSTATEQEDICVIGVDAKIEGNLTSSQALRIDGTIIGDVNVTDKILITETAKIIGNINCAKITVNGRVEGVIDAKDVDLKQDSVIKGDIVYTTIKIETGAQLESQLILNKNVVELKDVKRITG